MANVRSRCLSLLYLPLELRQQIYAYVLPTNQNGDSVEDCNWRSGSLSILRTSRRIHDEAITTLFTNVTFHVRVECDRILLIKTYTFPHYRIPLKVRLAFPGALGRNLWRVQTVAIELSRGTLNIEDRLSVLGLTQVSEGLRKAWEPQVSNLRSILSRIERIRWLHVYMYTGVTRYFLDDYWKILQPLETLSNVGTVIWSGDLTSCSGSALRERVEDSWERYSFTRLPGKIREQIYGYLLPSHTTVAFTSKVVHSSMQGVRGLLKYPRRREDRGYTAILRVCRRIHGEVTSLLYSTNVFQIEDFDLMHRGKATLSVQDDLERIENENLRRIRCFKIARTARGRHISLDEWINKLTQVVERLDSQGIDSSV